MKILITGGSGLLGSNLIKILQKNHDVFYPTHKEMDILDYSKILNYISDTLPNIVIHCAAIAKFINAEKQPINTIDTNIIGTCNIVKACAEYNIKMIYISTSHVFDGEQGNYKSTDNFFR